MLESLFSKVADSFCEYCEIFKNTYFEKYLRTAASESHLINTKLFIKILLCKNMLPEGFSQKFIHKQKCGTVRK